MKFLDQDKQDKIRRESSYIIQHSSYLSCNAQEDTCTRQVCFSTTLSLLISKACIYNKTPDRVETNQAKPFQIIVHILLFPCVGWVSLVHSVTPRNTSSTESPSTSHSASAGGVTPGRKKIYNK